MSWIDSGINLLDPRFDLVALKERAIAADISHMVLIASTIAESEAAIKLLNSHPFAHPNTFSQASHSKGITLACTAGVHPHYADDTNSQTWAKLKQIVADNTIAAIGECGLDFNRNFSSKTKQLFAFEQQLSIACEHNMGVYLHERDAFDEQISLLNKYACDLPFMVAHCFTGNKTQLSAYLALGCYVGITGWICDAKRGQDLQEAVADLPLDRLLLETDGPYLFPKTLRPRKSVNESCNIPHIASQVAKYMSRSVQEIEQHAYSNALNLFYTRELNDDNSGKT